MRKKGFYYEKKAADYLRRKGYHILEQNHYTPFGEIDLIAQDGDCLVFVEVKYRADTRGGHPLEAVNYKKQMRLRKASVSYLQGSAGFPPCRFDVIGILGEEYFHIENAF